MFSVLKFHLLAQINNCIFLFVAESEQASSILDDACSKSKLSKLSKGRYLIISFLKSKYLLPSAFIMYIPFASPVLIS